jgi:hypothetical protein
MRPTPEYESSPTMHYAGITAATLHPPHQQWLNGTPRTPYVPGLSALRYVSSPLTLDV